MNLIGKMIMNDFSRSCLECNSNNTRLLSPCGDYQCKDCGVIIDDDWWIKNQPILEIGEELIKIQKAEFERIYKSK